MKAFAALYEQLDATQSARAKVETIAAYLETAPAADAAWAVYFLSGRRLERTMAPSRLRVWGQEESGLPLWLFESCYHAVGNLAETVALLTAESTSSTAPSVAAGDPEAPTTLAEFIDRELLPLAKVDEDEQRQVVTSWWRRLDARQTFLVNEMLTGALRVGVARGLTSRAVAAIADVDTAVVARRLMGQWRPTARFYRLLVESNRAETSGAGPP